MLQESSNRIPSQHSNGLDGVIFRARKATNRIPAACTVPVGYFLPCVYIIVMGLDDDFRGFLLLAGIRLFS